MNINKRLKSVVIAGLLVLSASAFSAETKGVAGRIAALAASIETAHKASQISDSEKRLLKAEWEKLNRLYKKYYKDKKINSAEKKSLDSQINKFDLNLFRKKYD